jgi:hypothetical protein
VLHALITRQLDEVLLIVDDVPYGTETCGELAI